MKRLLLLLSLFCSLAQSEVLFGVQYYATLGMVKKIYPNATYSKLKPAWLGEDEAFIRISGSGMSGTLMIAFFDNRPLWANRTREDAVAFLNAVGREATEAAVEKYLADSRVRATQEDDGALLVNWVRWVPDGPIPLVKLESRYGKAACSMDEAFDTVCNWPKRALQAKMTEDGKAANMIDTVFTQAERSDGVKQSISR